MGSKTPFWAVVCRRQEGSEWGKKDGHGGRGGGHVCCPFSDAFGCSLPSQRGAGCKAKVWHRTRTHTCTGTHSAPHPSACTRSRALTCQSSRFGRQGASRRDVAMQQNIPGTPFLGNPAEPTTHSLALRYGGLSSPFTTRRDFWKQSLHHLEPSALLQLGIRVVGAG